MATRYSDVDIRNFLCRIRKFAWDLYLDLGVNPRPIIYRYRTDNYRKNCEIEPTCSIRVAMRVIAHRILLHAFKYNDRDIDQRIITFLSRTGFSPREICVIYEVCMVSSGRGTFEKGNITIHIQSENGENLHIKCCRGRPLGSQDSPNTNAKN